MSLSVMKVLERNIRFSNGKSHELSCGNFVCADSYANCSSIFFGITGYGDPTLIQINNIF